MLCRTQDERGGVELPCLQELRCLLGHLHAWGIPASAVTVDPLMAPHAEYYSGAMFQLHILPSGASAGDPPPPPDHNLATAVRLNRDCSPHK